MQIHPTRAAVDLAVAGIVVVAVSVVAQEPAVLAWGGAILWGLAIARAVTELGVARVRAAGFEMLWKEEPRMRRAARGDTLELTAEVRNRDSRAARYVELRPVCSPNIDVELTPRGGEVPANGRLKVTVKVRLPRVGNHGVHGLSLEVQGGPGLFEVPLTFANPFGFEVLPRAYAALSRSARGGRSRMMAEAGSSGPLSGDGSELRELREHVPGDAFKRIAWRASAKRGVLLVRDYEREERDLVWLILDASLELWAGAPGSAPLDLAIDELASVAQRHLARGDRVGLLIVAARVLKRVDPDRGPNHAFEILSALAHATGTLDNDRSDYDDADLAARVLEHMRPLDPGAAARVRSADIDRVARRAERLLARAPLTPGEPFADSKRERSMRQYLDAYGIGSPPRLEPERPKSDATLAQTLAKVVAERPRPSIVYIWSPPPDPALRPVIERALVKHPKRRVELRWVGMRQEPSIPHGPGPVQAAVAAVVGERTRVAEQRGVRALRQLGIQVEAVRRRRAVHRPDADPEGPAEKVTSVA